MSSRKTQAEPEFRLWRVFRLDDNGVRHEIASGLSAQAAKRLLLDFESKKHKQTYLKEVQPCAAQKD
jgi:hypothetical protein